MEVLEMLPNDRWEEKIEIPLIIEVIISYCLQFDNGDESTVWPVNGLWTWLLLRVITS